MTTHEPASPLPEGRADGRAAALEVLAGLSERSTDGKLRDAIAVVRSALWDEIESEAGQEGEGSSPPPGQNRVGICPECGRPDFNACQDCQGGNQ